MNTTNCTFQNVIILYLVSWLVYDMEQVQVIFLVCIVLNGLKLLWINSKCLAVFRNHVYSTERDTQAVSWLINFFHSFVPESLHNFHFFSFVFVQFCQFILLLFKKINHETISAEYIVRSICSQTAWTIFMAVGLWECNFSGCSGSLETAVRLGQLWLLNCEKAISPGVSLGKPKTANWLGHLYGSYSDRKRDFSGCFIGQVLKQQTNLAIYGCWSARKQFFQVFHWTALKQQIDLAIYYIYGCYSVRKSNFFQAMRWVTKHEKI